MLAFTYRPAPTTSPVTRRMPTVLWIKSLRFLSEAPDWRRRMPYALQLS